MATRRTAQSASPCDRSSRRLPRAARIVPALAVCCGIAAAADPAAPASAPDTTPAPRAESVLPTLTVTATRLAAPPSAQPFSYHRLDRSTLDGEAARTAVDAIDRLPGVFVQRTSPSQASPYLRGLTGYQTLLMFDGVRLNHLMMRPGPNQYSALIPDVSVGAIDVVLGSGSTVQGSDGLTGTVDFRLAEAGRGETSVASPFAKTRIASSEGYSVQAGVDGQVLPSLSYTIEGSWHDTGRLRGGDEAGDRLYGGARGGRVIPHTDYQEYAYAGRVRWTPDDVQRVDVAGGMTRQINAPRSDGYFENSNIATNISRYFAPQDFRYVHLRHAIATPSHLPDVQTTLWWHRFDETQIRERFTSASLATRNYRRDEFRDQVTTLGIDLQFTHRASAAGTHAVTWGATAYRDAYDGAYIRYQTSGAGNVDPTTAGPITTGGASEDRNTTLPDGSRNTGLGLFIQDDWHLDERWNVLAGVRWSKADWRAAAAAGRPGFASAETLDGDASAVTGSLRLGYQCDPETLVYAGVSQGFRAPTLNDLAGSDVVSGGTFTLVANPQLDPERSVTYELGSKIDSGADHASLAFFVTQIRDQIQAEYLDTNGNGSIGAGDSYRPVNGEGARLSGIEAACDWTIPGIALPAQHRLALFQTTSIVDGESKVRLPDGSIAAENIRRGNAFFGIAGLRYSLPAWWAAAQVRWQARYGETTLADQSDPRHYTVRGNVTASDGTMPGWAVFDLKTGWTSARNRTAVTLAIENLTDATYRTTGSSTDGPGLQGVLSVSARY